MSKTKFKVGDKVQLVPKFQKMYNSIGDKRGEVVKIESKNNRSVYWVSFENKKFMGEYYSYQLDRAQKFKKGDKVTFTPQAKQWLIDHGYWGEDEISKFIDPDAQYTIRNVYKSIKYSGYIYDLVGAGGVEATDDDLELVSEVPENKVDANSKFKVGDKVILTNKAKNWLTDRGYYVNVDFRQVYTIMEITHFHGETYRLKGMRGIRFFDDDLELYDENKEGLTVNEECHNTSNLISFNQHTDRMKKWVYICNEYLKEFCNRHDYAYQPEDWIGGEVGEIIEIADMFVTMDDIRYDVDNNIPTDKFSDWYWNSVEHSELGLTYMNYPSYCKGAPDPYTQEQIQSIREGQMRVRKAKEDLMKTIDELGGDFSKALF